MSEDAPLAAVHEALGGEDAEVKSRERFRVVTQAALERFQDTVLNDERGRELRHAAVTELAREVNEAAQGYLFYLRYLESEGVALRRQALDEQPDIADLTCEDP